jgi:threonine/homoserine/homoserine lactone efflux protein
MIHFFETFPFDFAKGILAGALLGLPAGPAGLLVLRTWVLGGTRKGYAAVGGMALADGVAAGVTAWGLGLAAPSLSSHLGAVHLTVGLVLCLSGLGFLYFEKDEKDLGHWTAWPILIFWPTGLVLTNPGTWAAYGALFLGMNRGSTLKMGSVATGIGAFVGVLTAWIVLGGFITRWKKVFSTVDESRLTYWSDTLVGGLMFVFGFVLLLGG